MLVLDNNLEFVGSIMGALCCSQCPAALVSLLCSMATTQNKKNNKIAAEITVPSVCSIACVMVWLCSKDHVMLLCSIHNITDAIGVSIAASRACKKEWVNLSQLVYADACIGQSNVNLQS